MKITASKIHILVDSREPSISFAKLIFEETKFRSLGTVEHIRNITFVNRLQVLCDTSSPEDIIIIAVSWLSDGQLKKVQKVLGESCLASEQIILASYSCFSHIPEWCDQIGCTFRPIPFKRRKLSHKDSKKGSSKKRKQKKRVTQGGGVELIRIWVQYRLMLAIISRSQLLGTVIRQLILNQAASKESISNEYDRAMRYFELGEPDMAGGSYSCEKQKQPNPIDSLRSRINKIAATDFNVLIKGDSGSGKEAVAWSIHEFSARRDKPFIIVNCAGLPDELLESEMFGYVKGSHNQAFEDAPGLLENAAGGTLFLDELPDMSVRIQAKLLRFLENGEYRPLGGVENRYADVRIIAAAQQERLAAATGIRPDLKSRIGQLNVEILPLRYIEQQSPGTISKIAFVLLERYTWTSIFHGGQTCELSPLDVKELQRSLASDKNTALLSRQKWKESNIRELNNFLRQWVVFGDGEIERLNSKDCEKNNTTSLAASFTGIYDDALQAYLQEPKNRIEFKTLSSEKPLRDLKKSYMRHLFKIYSRIIEDENEKRDLPRKPTQKELAALMDITENTLSRLLN